MIGMSTLLFGVHINTFSRPGGLQVALFMKIIMKTTTFLVLKVGGVTIKKTMEPNLGPLNAESWQLSNPPQLSLRASMEILKSNNECFKTKR